MSASPTTFMVDQTGYDDAADLRDDLLESVTLPEGWTVQDDDYPFEEAIPEGSPDDYLRQYEVVGFSNGESYIGVWWLRGGERLQAYYDDSDVWGGVLDIDRLVVELSETME